jgi:hypothetical protein
MFKTSISKGEIIVKGETFVYEVYFNPSDQPAHIQRYLIDRFGSRIVKGKPCLETTKEVVRKGLEDQIYTALALIKNKNKSDAASASLQFYDWCQTEKPQLWLGDLCRISSETIKPQISPVEGLIEVLGQISKKHRIRKLYLMIKNVDQNYIILPKIYNNYGFKEIQTCQGLADYKVMMKDLIQTTGSLKRKRPTRKAVNLTK